LALGKDKPAGSPLPQSYRTTVLLPANPRRQNLRFGASLPVKLDGKGLDGTLFSATATTPPLPLIKKRNISINAPLRYSMGMVGRSRSL
jgi:hypothetical protein